MHSNTEEKNSDYALKEFDYRISITSNGFIKQMGVNLIIKTAVC